GWTGREYDSETGLQYNRARYYDPKTGRWTSQDPLGFDAGDSNLYRYVRNAPAANPDPSGLFVPSIPFPSISVPPYLLLDNLPLRNQGDGPQLTIKIPRYPHTSRPFGRFLIPSIFELDRPSKKGGVIVQHIQRRIFVWDGRGNPVKDPYGIKGG